MAVYVTLHSKYRRNQFTKPVLRFEVIPFFHVTIHNIYVKISILFSYKTEIPGPPELRHFSWRYL